MSKTAGFFVDWDGNARSTLDPGGGYLCEADIEKAGIKAPLVPGSHPWGRREDGF
ncbi:MAG: hypothetical protein JZU55_05230 [Afipia sp.]|nr:hypothetical protein [Afipia sp.]